MVKKDKYGFRVLVIMYIFNNCADYDFPSKKSDKLIAFTENELYKCEGRTHGLISHAIKHFKDFEPEKMSSFIKDVISIIKNTKHIYLYDDRGNIVDMDETAKAKINEDMIYNTMDMINDKLLSNTYLEPTEIEIKPILDSIAKQYYALLCLYIKNAIDIDVVDNIRTIAKEKRLEQNCQIPSMC